MAQIAEIRIPLLRRKNDPLAIDFIFSLPTHTVQGNMPPKSPVWNHFYGNKTKFKTNQTHNNAWCKYCVRAHIQTLQAQDRDLVTQGHQSFIRGEDELVKQGQ